MIVGVSMITLGFGATLMIFIFKPDMGAEASNLATTYMGGILAMITSLVLGQSAVDWRIHGSNESRNEKRAENITERREEIYKVEYEGDADLTLGRNERRRRDDFGWRR